MKSNENSKLRQNCEILKTFNSKLQQEFSNLQKNYESILKENQEIQNKVLLCT